MVKLRLTLLSQPDAELCTLELAHTQFRGTETIDEMIGRLNKLLPRDVYFTQQARRQMHAELGGFRDRQQSVALTVPVKEELPRKGGVAIPPADHLLKECRKQRVDLEHRLAGVQQEREQVEQQLGACRQERQQLEQDLVQMALTEERLNERIRNAEAAQAKAEKQLERKQQQLNALTQSVTQLQQENRRLENEVERLRSRQSPPPPVPPV